MRREKHKLLFYPNLAGSRGTAARKPKEVELVLDTKGAVAGLANSEFSSPRQLGECPGAKPAVPGMRCQAGFSVYGRTDGDAGGPAGAQCRRWRRFAQSGYRFQELMVSLVKLRDSAIVTGVRLECLKSSLNALGCRGEPSSRG